MYLLVWLDDASMTSPASQNERKPFVVHSLLNNPWQSGAILLLNKRWRFGALLLLNKQ
jgi:hypothetical protein